MSNDAALLGGDSLIPEWLVIYTRDEDPSQPEETLLAAEYCVPLFWLAMFSGDDLRHANHFEDGEPFPYLSNVRDKALELYFARREFISTHFSTASQYFGPWERYLAGVSHRYLSVDLCEIVFMVEGVEERVIRALASFEDPTPTNINGLTATMSVNYDANRRDFDSLDRPYVDRVLGFSHGGPDSFSVD